MKKFFSLFLLLTFFVGTGAQTRRPNAPRSEPKSPVPERKLVEKVRTSDGREILLYNDSTYELTAVSKSPTLAIVNIKAGVITRGGDVKPVVRKEFLVFNQDIKAILASVNDSGGKPLDVVHFYFADKFRELDNSRTLTEAMEKLKPIIVATFTTDFQGNATLKLPDVNATYWIYGSSQEIGRSACFWYLEITPNKTLDLVLDNNNASLCG